MAAHKPSETSGQRPGLIVQIEATPASELFLSLCVFSDRDNPWRPYEAGEAWFEAIRKKLTPALLATIEHFSFQNPHMWGAIWALGSMCPPPGDIPALLAYLRTLDPLELRLHLLGHDLRQHRRTPPTPGIVAAAQGDVQAQEKFLRTSFPDDARWQRTLRWMFSLEAAAVKDQLLDIVQGWYDEVFRGQEPQFMPILAREVEAKRALQVMHSPEQLIEMCTGWEYVPEPGIHRVLLIPSYVARPLNSEATSGDTHMFCYPASGDSLLADPAAPPAHLLHLAKALGDERRLRLLKMLASDSYTLQELADAFGVAKTTIHHHLIQLRSVGLVRMRMRDKRFSLRQYPIEHLGEWLRRYLGEPSQEE